MYIIRPPPMSTRLAKDSARAVVASEQASAIRASNFTTMRFTVCSPFAFSSPGCPATSQITPCHFLLGEPQKPDQLWEPPILTFGESSDVRFAARRYQLQDVFG